MKIITILGLLLIFASCSSMKVNDSAFMKISDDSSYELIKSGTATAGNSKIKIVSLKNAGDSYTVDLNKPFLFSLEDFDPNDLTIVTEINKDMGSATIKALNKRNLETIEIKDTCQTYCSYDLDYFPTFTVASNLKKEQIIFTPIYNNKKDCKLIGYQIRYGDIQLAGCKESAGEIYDIFKGCRTKSTYTKSPINKKNKNEDKKITISKMFFDED